MTQAGWARPTIGPRISSLSNNPLATAGLLLIVSIVVRGQVLGYPLIHIDEQFYLLIGEALLHGQLPYVDVWDRKPIGLFLIYALARLIGGEGIWQYQILALLSVAATAFLISRIARRIAPPPGALAAALVYVVWLNIGSGAGGQAPVFYNLPMAGAALAIARLLDRPAGARLSRLQGSGALAMLLVGIAMQMKYTALFEGLAFGIFLLFIARREGLHPRKLFLMGAFWVACALAPTLLALLAYAAMGELDAFMFANFYSIFYRAPATSGELPLRLVRITAFVAPLIILGVLGAKREFRKRPSITYDFVAIWFFVACLGVLALGTYFRHYALPLFLPGAVVTATAFGASGPLRRFALGTLLIAFVIGQLMLFDVKRMSGSRAMLDRMVASMHRHPGCLFIYNGHPILYHMSRRCRTTRYWLPSHFSKANEANALGVDIDFETRHILSQRPGLIVTTLPARPTENRQTRAILNAAIARDYALVHAEQAGRTVHQLYALRRTR